MPNRFTNKNDNENNTSSKITRKEKLNKIQENIKLKTPQKAKTVSKAKNANNKTNKVSQNKLKLLITIVNRNKAEFYLDLIQSFEVNMQTAILGNGMAPQSMLELLGLAHNEKSVIFSIIQENKISDALAAIEEKFNTIKDGKGIAFTVPLTSVIGTLIYGFLSNNKMAVKEEKSKWTNQNTN